MNMFTKVHHESLQDDVPQHVPESFFGEKKMQDKCS